MTREERRWPEWLTGGRAIAALVVAVAIVAGLWVLGQPNEPFLRWVTSQPGIGSLGPSTEAPREVRASSLADARALAEQAYAVAQDNDWYQFEVLVTWPDGAGRSGVYLPRSADPVPSEVWDALATNLPTGVSVRYFGGAVITHVVDDLASFAGLVESPLPSRFRIRGLGTVQLQPGDPATEMMDALKTLVAEGVDLTINNGEELGRTTELVVPRGHAIDVASALGADAPWRVVDGSARDQSHTSVIPSALLDSALAQELRKWDGLADIRLTAESLSIASPIGSCASDGMDVPALLAAVDERAEVFLGCSSVGSHFRVAVAPGSRDFPLDRVAAAAATPAIADLGYTPERITVEPSSISHIDEALATVRTLLGEEPRPVEVRFGLGSATFDATRTGPAQDATGEQWLIDAWDAGA